MCSWCLFFHYLQVVVNVITADPNHTLFHRSSWSIIVTHEGTCGMAAGAGYARASRHSYSGCFSRITRALRQKPQVSNNNNDSIDNRSIGTTKFRDGFFPFSRLIVFLMKYISCNITFYKDNPSACLLLTTLYKIERDLK